MLYTLLSFGIHINSSLYDGAFDRLRLRVSNLQWTRHPEVA